MAGERHGHGIGTALARHGMCELAFRENYNTHFLFDDFFPENRAVLEIV
jgi:hypothetical protein